MLIKHEFNFDILSIWKSFGLRSSKVRMVVKWESEGEFTIGSITFIMYGSHQKNQRVNSSSLFHFTAILTLEDPNLKVLYIQSYITILTKAFNLTVYYLKNFTNRSIWLNDNVKLFYIDSVSKLIS